MYFNNFNVDGLLNNGFIKLNPLDKYLDTKSIASEILNNSNNKNFIENSSANKIANDKLHIDRDLLPILEKISIKNFGFKPETKNQYHITRIVYPGEKNEKYRTHFDSHLFTLVIPILIPNHNFENEISESIKYGGRGELCFLPNARKNKSNEIINILQKISFKRYSGLDGVKKMIKENDVKFETFENNQPLLFMGRSTLHTNLSLSLNSNTPRISLLSHFFDPSGNFSIGSILRNLRSR